MYATQNDDEPNKEFPPGGNNSANHDNALGGLVAVGSYINSSGPYGTFDQTGSLWEWNEAIAKQSPDVFEPVRAMRGGSWAPNNLDSSNSVIDTADRDAWLHAAGAMRFGQASIAFEPTHRQMTFNYVLH